MQKERQIAEIMLCVFEQVLWPSVSNYLSSRIKPLNIRIGAGRATYFRAEPSRNTVVIGVKMVHSKLNGEHRSWLSSREIIGCGYYGGEATIINSLAQTLCHEFAHLIQINRYGRQYGSVHNRDFYGVLSAIHQDGLAEKVLLELKRYFSENGIEITAPKPSAPEIQSPDCMPVRKGQWIQFRHNGQLKEAKVIRLNRKTVSARPKNASKKLAYWRIPYQLIER